ncbi:MAG: hypothetical protein ACXVRZ_06385 [Gaiellaceae bacterium]
MRGRPSVELPRREMLEALARHYHHVQNEHKRSAPGSSVRRRLDERLADARERFERLLDEWVPEDVLRRAWHDHLHYRAPAPEGPPPIRPLVFRGVSDAGAVVEVRGRNDEFDVEIDGSLVERVSASKELASSFPLVRFRLDHTEFHETFASSDDALQALERFVSAGGSPPWDHAPELFADGLIDTHADLTARGRRALAGRE